MTELRPSQNQGKFSKFSKKIALADKNIDTSAIFFFLWSLVVPLKTVKKNKIFCLIGTSEAFKKGWVKLTSSRAVEGPAYPVRERVKTTDTSQDSPKGVDNETKSLATP